MEKGILTSKQESAIAKMIDDAIQLKGLLELVDGYAAKAIVTLVDDNLINKLNIDPDLKVKIGELADAAINENIELCESIGSDILNSLIDIPGVEEDQEAVLFEGALKIIVASIIKYVKKSE